VVFEARTVRFEGEFVGGCVRHLLLHENGGCYTTKSRVRATRVFLQEWEFLLLSSARLGGQQRDGHGAAARYRASRRAADDAATRRAVS
jgi:hypothetical protein